MIGQLARKGWPNYGRKEHKDRRKEEPEPETIVKWEGEQPFLDAEELFNPRLHEMRMIMSRCHSKKWLKAHHPEIVDDDEIIKRYPMLEPLLKNEKL